MNKRKSKKLYYRRATWENQGKSTLETLLKDAHDGLPTTGDRTFTSSSSEVKGARIYHSGKGLFLQIASYVPGEPTSTIDKNKSVKNATITAEPAPSGKDFLDGDVFVLVRGNHVILCPSGARESVATNYFFHVLHKAGKKKIANSLDLDRVAKTSKLNMIHEEGVKEVLLGTSLYDASLMQFDAKSSKISSFKALIAQQMERVFAKDPTLKEISDLENLNISLSIKFDGKEGRKKHLNPEFGVAGRKRLMKTSEKIIEEYDADDEEGFVIVTGANNRITAEEVRVADSFSIETLGKSLSHLDAWEKLSKYYDQLENSGVLSK